MGIRRGLLIAGLLACLLGPPPAHAVEYRLEVANLWETALYPFAKPAELRDGASGPGLEQLEASLDQGAMPHAVVLRDRTLRWSSESVAHAYGTVRVLAEIKAAGAQPTTYKAVLLWRDPGYDFQAPGRPGHRRSR